MDSRGSFLCQNFLSRKNSMANHISPVDESGKPVDWWFLYKVPKLDGQGTDPATTGYEYLYFDPSSHKPIKSGSQLTDGKGALDLTLAALFTSTSATTGWILYNDELPAGIKGSDKASFGHTKGVLGFDTASKTGFWLLHSWPKYANPAAKELPVPDYGQTYLCISLDMDMLGTIAQQMIDHQEPQVYSTHIPASLNKSHPLYLLHQGVDPNAAGDHSVIDGKTVGGLSFKVIAKNRKWGLDFWNDLVGPTLGVDLDVETWIRGKVPSVLDADGKHKIIDVKYINFHPLGFPVQWSETRDHAKWGLSVGGNWICVGDINRMISQEKRGGGTIAFQHPALWNALKQTDLLVPPPGMTVEQTKSLIKSTHRPA